MLVVPVCKIRLRYWAFLLKNLAMVHSRKKRLELEDRWFQALCPIGEDPIAFTTTMKSWAGELALFERPKAMMVLCPLIFLSLITSESGVPNEPWYEAHV